MNNKARQQIQLIGQKQPRNLPLLADLERAVQLLIDVYDQGGHMLLCGNGGSAADSEHIAGELMKGFLLNRPIPLSQQKQILERSRRSADPGLPDDDAELADALKRLQLGLPAIPLVSQAAISSAIINDLGGDLVFAQQVVALGRPGDVLLGISTSGNARNVILAMQLARGLGLKTLALTGADGGRLALLADICLRVPAVATPDVQELHLPLYHALCAALEMHFFFPDDSMHIT